MKRCSGCESGGGQHSLGCPAAKMFAIVSLAWGRLSTTERMALYNVSTWPGVPFTEITCRPCVADDVVGLATEPGCLPHASTVIAIRAMFEREAAA